MGTTGKPRLPAAMAAPGPLQAAGRLAEAEEVLRRALAENPPGPQQAEAWVRLGSVHQEQARPAEAAEAYRAAVAAAPADAAAWNGLGTVLAEIGRPADAVECFRRAIGTRPDWADPARNAAAAFAQMGRWADAVDAYRGALRRRPDDPDALHGLALALVRVDRLDEAAAAWERALQFRPDFAGAVWSLAAARLEQARPAEALDLALASAGLAAGRPEPCLNVGRALRDLGRPAEAVAWYDRALAARPDYALARWNRAVALLQAGDYPGGWPAYESRLEYEPGCRRTDVRAPPWDGQDVAGRTVLVYGEQGFGDAIQFVRYVPLLARLGARVVVECRPELVRLFRSVAGAAEVVPVGGAAAGGVPAPDFHCPLPGLPLRFGTTLDTLPEGDVPYLRAERAGAWDGAVAAAAKVDTAAGACPTRVGLCWAGNPRPDPHRTSPPELLAPLAAVGQVRFYSLCKGRGADVAGPLAALKVVDLTDALTDFADTAGLIANLDLVVTIDTAVAHLAGALGKPTWVMLRSSADWRWLLGRSDSPWYPTARLFRQPRPGDWAPAVRDVVSALARRQTGGGGGQI